MAAGRRRAVTDRSNKSQALERLIVSDCLRMARAATAELRGDRTVDQAMRAPQVQRRLSSSRRVFGVSIGKASPEMHAGLHQSVPPSKWAGGIVVSLVPHLRVEGAEHWPGDHPTPGERSAVAARNVARFLEDAQLTPDDLVVFCISGGTSSLIAGPPDGLSLAEMQTIYERLLLSGIDVASVNTVRRMMSALHNGGLARRAFPARQLGLILTDTGQGGLSAVGSGPTFQPIDVATEAIEVLNRVITGPLLDKAVDAVLARSIDAGDHIDVVNENVGAPADALSAAVRLARSSGYRVFPVAEFLDCPAREAAEILVGAVRDEAPSDRMALCAVAAGEVSVRVDGHGRGGRCQQVAWEAIPLLRDVPRSCVLAFATDGRDYLPAVGGAYATTSSWPALHEAGLSWREIADQNNTYVGLAALGQLVPGNRTGTNVCDLYFAVVAGLEWST